MLAKTVIVEDHRLVMEGIQKLIEPVCEIVGTTTSGRDAVRLAADLSPDLMLMDITLPDLNGLDAARQIKQANSNIRIVLVTVHKNREYVLEAFKVGASGYVFKQASAAELLNAIREVQKGRFYFAGLISERFEMESSSTETLPLKLFSVLTPPQRQVLQLVGEGKSGKEIAASLALSMKTVEFHKMHLMKQLNLSTTPQLIRYAIECGIVPL